MYMCMQGRASERWQIVDRSELGLSSVGRGVGGRGRGRRCVYGLRGYYIMDWVVVCGAVSGGVLFLFCFGGGGEIQIHVIFFCGSLILFIMLFIVFWQSCMNSLPAGTSIMFHSIIQ